MQKPFLQNFQGERVFQKKVRIKSEEKFKIQGLKNNYWKIQVLNAMHGLFCQIQSLPLSLSLSLGLHQNTVIGALANDTYWQASFVARCPKPQPKYRLAAHSPLFVENRLTNFNAPLPLNVDFNVVQPHLWSILVLNFLSHNPLQSDISFCHCFLGPISMLE